MIDLYDAICRRKSVRNFRMSPLEESILSGIREFAAQAEPLDATIRIAVSIFDHVEKRPFAVKAPHYLCLYSEPKGVYLMNAGYMLQQADLYLSRMGLGSCYLGLAKPQKRMPGEDSSLAYVMMLAFGRAAENVHRENINAFRRNRLDEISTVDGGEALIEPCRLAPSASNTQPWFFTGTPERVQVCRKKFNPVKAAVYDKLNQVDTGIALCHLALSAQHLGKKASFVFEKEKAPKGCEHMVSAVISV
ncbi:MAG: nitroreductase family protein [Christensenellales bacterium]